MTTRSSHDGFLAALYREIEVYGEKYGREESVETIYFGGGTPSLLSVESVAGLLDATRTHFNIAGNPEISFELNPDDVDSFYLKRLREAGVNRLSIGIQSFFEADLSWMNRAHSAEEAQCIIPMAREAGFENISVDLIFGFPTQSAETWQRNLSHVAALKAPHISTYSLTVEPRTPLNKQIQRGLEEETPDDVLAERYRTTMEFLKRHGYDHYEVSSFALPGSRSRHNQAYWRHANYIGMGPSAHSFWSSGGVSERWANARSLKQYEAWPAVGTPPIEFRETLSSQMLADEYIMLSLRTAEGIDLSRLKTEHGVVLDDSVLLQLNEQGWIEQDSATVRLTEEGMLVCDAVTREVMA